MKTLELLALIVGLSLGAAPGLGADKHDHGKRGPNGGEVVDAGPYHLELVVKGQELSLYVQDNKHGKVAVKEAKATATVMSSGSKATVTLAPTGDNVLTGAGKFEAKEDLRVLVSLALPGRPAQQARFTPLHKEGGDQKGHKH